MNRTLVFGLALLVAGLLASHSSAAPVPVSAADAPLAVVPASAPIVVHVKGIDRVRGRLTTTLKAVDEGMGGMAAGQIDAAFGSLFEGRKLDSLAANGPVFMVFLQLPSAQQAAEPPLAIIIRVTSAKAFKDSFLTEDERKTVKSESDGIDKCEIKGSEGYIVDKKDYIVLTPKKEHAELMAKQYAGLDGKLPKDMATKLVSYDAGVYVNLETVNAAHGDSIRQGRDMFMAVLDQAAAAGAGAKEQMEMAKKMYSGMFQMVLDGTGLVAALDFRPEGIALHLQQQFGGDTDSAQLLKDQKPTQLDRIGRLPAGQMMYTGIDLGPQMLRNLMMMMQGLSAGEGEVKKAFDAAVEQMASANGKSNYTSMSYPPSGVTIQEYDHPAKAVAGTLAMYKAIGEGGGYMGGMLKSKPEVKNDAEELRGIKFTHVKMVFDIDKMIEANPAVGAAGDQMKVMYKKMLGDGLNLWFGVEGKHVLTAMGKDWNDAKARLQAYFENKAVIGQSTAFQTTQKQLPSLASFVFYIDAGMVTNWTVETVVVALKGMPGLPINLPENIKHVDTTPAFIGMSTALQPRQGSFDLFIPVTAIQEIKKVIMPLLGGN